MDLASRTNPAPRGSDAPGLLVLFAAAGWLIGRIFLGLDFTDEMQYYGELASLVRTGKFFQADLFVQQLGYLLVYPFFKLHHLAFPDQSYLILFGRVVLLLSYAGVALLFWRLTRQSYSRGERVTGLSAFAAWIPFQIFAIGYNSIAYLLIVAGLALWNARALLSPARYATGIAAIGAALTVAYPTAGLAAIALAVIDARIHGGWAGASRLTLAAAVGGALVAIALFALHGKTFAVDLADAVKFSGAFGTGTVAARPEHVRKLCVYGLAVLLLLREARLRQARAIAPTWHPARPGWTARAIAVLAAAMLLWASVRLPGADFATILFFVTPTVVVASGGPMAAELAKLLIAGLTLAGVVAITSGNGAYNFGVGAAGVLPFLVLHSARAARNLSSRIGGTAATALAPGFAALLLLNGALHPYREQRLPASFQRITGVPAFAGIHTSPVKIAALQAVQTLTADVRLAGKRVLVAGPHPWIYFAAGGVPTTPMVFMHFSAERESVYDLVAERMFRTGEPDFVFLTNRVPAAIGSRIREWSARGQSERSVELPAAMLRAYHDLTGYGFGGKIHLLSRSQPEPATRRSPSAK